MMLTSSTPPGSTVRLDIVLTALTLAFILVSAVLNERRSRRLQATMRENEQQAKELSRAITDLAASVDERVEEAADRHNRLSRDLRIDRMYFRDVLQDLGAKMDSMSALERAQFEVLREMNDTGEAPVYQP